MTSLLDYRVKLGAALAPVEPGDPDVLTNLVDAIAPPALMIGWGDPWLTPDTACLRAGRLVVTAVAARLQPGEGISDLEALVQYVLDRLAGDSSPWPLDSVSGPRIFTIAKTTYLAARITVRVVVTS
jgi:hypothetical protein